MGWAVAWHCRSRGRQGVADLLVLLVASGSQFPLGTMQLADGSQTATSEVLTEGAVENTSAALAVSWDVAVGPRPMTGMHCFP